MAKLAAATTEDQIHWLIRTIPANAKDPYGRMHVEVCVGQRHRDPFRVGRSRTLADPLALDWAYAQVPQLIVKRRCAGTPQESVPPVREKGSWHNTDYKKREGTGRKASGSVRIPWEDTYKQWILGTGLELPTRVEVKVIEKTNRRSFLGAVGEQVADGVEGYLGTFVSNVAVPENWMELADIVLRPDWRQYVTFRVVPVDIEDIRILFETGVLPEHHGVESLLHHDQLVLA